MSGVEKAGGGCHAEARWRGGIEQPARTSPRSPRLRVSPYAWRPLQ